MMFNLIGLAENYPIFQILFSFILISGLSLIGDKTLEFLNLKSTIIKFSDLNYQNVLIGLNSFIFISYPLIFLFKNAEYISFLSNALFLLGIVNIIIFIFKNFPSLKFKKIKFFDENIDKNFIIIILISYLILSLPIATHADVFGYHFVLAQDLITKGIFDVNLLNLHTFFFSAGEFYTAIGLFWGAENFVSLLQFFGIYSFYGLIKKNINRENYYVLLILFSSPVIIFLASSHKAQLIHIFSNSLIFFIFFIKDTKFINKKIFLKLSYLAIVILLVSYHSKFSFILSSTLIALKVFYENYKIKRLRKIIVFSLVFLSFSILPVFFWKVLNLDYQIIELFYSPLPSSVPGVENFKLYLFNYKRDFLSLTNIFIPHKANEITKSLGIGGLLMFTIFFINNRKVSYCKIFIFIFLVLNYLFGQFTARSIFEAFVWIILIFSTCKININLTIFKSIIRIQAAIVILLINYGNFILIPSMMSHKNKLQILNNYADGYSLITWAKKTISNDKAIISLHRSVYFGGKNFISSEFIDYANKDIYINSALVHQLKLLKPKYILTYGRHNFSNSNLKRCFGKLVKSKKNVGFKGTRNPLNKSNFYDGFIYEFKISKFPKCWKD